MERIRMKRLAPYVGTAIGIAGLAFAVYAVYLAREEITFGELDPIVFALAAGVGLCGMLVVGANWIRIIRLIGYPVKFIRGIRWYYVGQLGKYVPGGLWAILGRAELATRGGLPRDSAYPSVAMSLVTTYAAAAATGVAFMALGGASLATKIWWSAGSVGIIVVTILGLSRPVVDRITAVARRFGLDVSLAACPPRVSATAIVATIPAWVLIGTATGLCAVGLDISFGYGDLISATSFSWLAGFLVIPLPGGLGVREGVFIALWRGETAEAAAVAVVARLAFVMADIAGAALSVLANRVFRIRA